MQTITIEPLRWQEDPARVNIAAGNGHPRAFFQITAPKEIAAMCVGRPVEELPRILALLGPGHHLVAAMALDRLFQVEPPAPAVNMRTALLQALYFVHHLRKTYFMLTAWQDPFAAFRASQRRRQPRTFTPQMLADMMHHTGLAQEAAVILGGRSEHPLTALAGGVSRYLKDEHYERLTEIAATCLDFVPRLVKMLREPLFGPKGALQQLPSIALPPLAGCTMASGEPEGPPGAAQVQLHKASGELLEQFAPAELPEKIGLQHEPWTYEPFAYLKAQGWQGLDAESVNGLYFVGPLARLNSGQALSTPLAEAERQRLLETLGEPLPLSVAAAFWAHLVELLQAAEKMQALFVKENFLGPSVRTVPDQMGKDGCAALEAPQGLIFHDYRVDSSGIVQDLQVFSTATQNNALRCLITQQAVTAAGADLPRRDTLKPMLEISLLPF